MGAKFGKPPAPLPATAFRNPDPRGCLDSIAHGVISWTLAKKEDMMSKDKGNSVFRAVMKGTQDRTNTEAERRRNAELEARTRRERERLERESKRIAAEEAQRQRAEAAHQRAEEDRRRRR